MFPPVVSCCVVICPESFNKTVKFNYQFTGNAEYKAVIGKNITFLKNKLYLNQELLHTYKDGQAKYSAYLDDYANLIQGLLDAYETLFVDEYTIVLSGEYKRTAFSRLKLPPTLTSKSMRGSAIDVVIATCPAR